jgi:archaellum biogenesis ATPase FlaH
MRGAAKANSRPIQSGIKEFDELSGGLPLGSLTVLHGQHKGGKTTLAMNIVEHVAVEERRPVLYLIQSFSAETLLAQIACSRAGLDFLDFAEAKLTSEDRTVYEAAIKELSQSWLMIDDTPALEDGEIVERVERFAMKHPYGLVIVDHMYRDSYRVVDRCSQALKSAAVKTGTAIIATAHHSEVDDDGCPVCGVGISHADFSWHLFRWWCSSSNLYPRDEVNFSFIDRRTGDQRLSLDLRLDEKLRRFRVVGAKTHFPSLREERLRQPSQTVYHRLLGPAEEPPPGSRLVYLSGVDPEVEITTWESSRRGV